MPRYEYSYYVTLLICNQFYRGGGRRVGQIFHRGVAPWPPLRTATGNRDRCLFLVSHPVSLKLYQKCQVTVNYVIEYGSAL